MNTYTEDALIEQPSIALFKELGWEHISIRRTRDLLLPKLISGEVHLGVNSDD